MSRLLVGKTAVVTGASRGIGNALARRLLAEGAKVAVVARDESALRAFVDSFGTAVVVIPADLSDRAGAGLCADACRLAFGVPDIIVNNAGGFPLAAVEETSPEMFRTTFDLNLFAAFILVQSFLGEMKERRSGHVVGIGSVADRHTFPGNSAYAASKFALRAFHEVLRAETRGSGVRTTLVSPGPVDTNIWDAIDPDARPGFTPRSSMLRPEAVAESVMFVLTQPSDINIEELRLARS